VVDGGDYADQIVCLNQIKQRALLAQLGERQTEDLKVLCSIHRQSNFLHLCLQNLRFHFLSYHRYQLFCVVVDADLLLSIGVSMQPGKFVCVCVYIQENILVKCETEELRQELPFGSSVLKEMIECLCCVVC
jgi:hypothetical protein